MPGAMRKMGVYLGLVEEDDPDGYDRADGAGYGGHSGGHAGSHAAGQDAQYDRSSASSRSGGSRGGTATLSRDGWSEPTRAEGSYGEAYGRYTEEYDDDQAAPAASVAVVAPPARPAAPPAASYRITTLHPRTYNEARQIGEHYRMGTPVIMNLSEMDDADAKRLVDFAAGITFGLRGRLERVTAKVFLLSPQNVTVTAEDKARIVEGGFFNQS